MTTAICNEIADYEWLTGEEAAQLLSELAADSSPLHTTIARLRRQLSTTRAHLIVEQVDLRRRAAEKFIRAGQMFFTRTALEQATDEWTAAYKASRVGEFFQNSHPRLGETRLLADLCCGIGGDLFALAQRVGSSSTPTVTIGIDLNPIVAHLAAANARVVLNRDIEIRTQDVADLDLDGIIAWHIDPDRRHSGRRTTSLDFCTPDRNLIDRLLARSPNAVIKLAPATNVPKEWLAICEREWIGRDRQCRQQVAWHGNLAISPGYHRATIVGSPPRYSGEGQGEGPSRTIMGQPNQPISITHEPAQYLFDVDPAVLAAHLTGALAAEQHLQALSAGPTYLTSNSGITTDPALASFEVLDVLPLRTRTLIGHLRAKGIGQLEIKKRGIDIDPATLRRDLKLRGNNTATLLLTNIAGRPTAILANRIS